MLLSSLISWLYLYHFVNPFGCLSDLSAYFLILTSVILLSIFAKKKSKQLCVFRIKKNTSCKKICFKFTVYNFTMFVETFEQNKYKFGEISINRRVNLEDIYIYGPTPDELIKLAHDIKSFEAANSYYFEENKENTLKLINKCIVTKPQTPSHNIEIELIIIEYFKTINIKMYILILLFFFSSQTTHEPFWKKRRDLLKELQINQSKHFILTF